MSWESRGRCRVYTRSKRLGRRVVREYVGTGVIGELAAAADSLRRAARRSAAEALRAEQARWREALAPLLELGHITDLLVRAALLGAGYRQHARSAWRMRRHVHHDDDGPEARRDP
jgi:hypothetical protein